MRKKTKKQKIVRITNNAELAEENMISEGGPVVEVDTKEKRRRDGK